MSAEQAMPWSCEQIEGRLSDYLDELLSPDERQEFSAHARGCARCAPLVANVGGIVAQIRQLEPPVPPADLIPRILASTLGPRTARKGWMGWLLPLWQPRFALGIASVVASFSIVLYSTQGHAARPALASLNPINFYRTADRHAHLAYARSVKFVNDLRLVYEIQSRLQPETAPQPPAEPATNPGQSNQPKKPSGQVNRAIPSHSQLTSLALALAPLPERSLR
jgi:hypothetical protein